MTLPSNFDFKHLGEGQLYTAEYFDGKYVVSWNNPNHYGHGFTDYEKSYVEETISQGTWVIYKEPKPESQLVKSSLGLCNLISDKKDASQLISGELEALHLLRRLITRLLDDHS